MDAHSAKRSDESEQEQPRSRLELSKKKNGAADMTTAFGGGSSNGSPDNVGHLWSDHDTENDAPWFGSDCATKNDAPWFGDSDNDDCRRVEAVSQSSELHAETSEFEAWQASDGKLSSNRTGPRNPKTEATSKEYAAATR
jgi:hypothetical protein